MIESKWENQFVPKWCKNQLQWLAKKLAVSISVIRKLAVVFIPVEIENSIDIWSGRPGNLP